LKILLFSKIKAKEVIAITAITSFLLSIIYSKILAIYMFLVYDYIHFNHKVYRKGLLEMAVELVRKIHFRKDGVLNKEGFDKVGPPVHDLLHPVWNDDKLGFTTLDGDIVIPVIHDSVFTPEYQAVKVGNILYLAISKDNLYGLLKYDGKEVSEVTGFIWPNMRVDKMNENLLPVGQVRWGYFNVETQKLQVPLLFDEVEGFKNGRAPVCLYEKWTSIDEYGKMIVDPQYLLDFHFEDDFAIVNKGGYCIGPRKRRNICNSAYGLLTKDGHEIVSDYSLIERVDFNTFKLAKVKKGKVKKSIKQFIGFPDYVIVIDKENNDFSAINYNGIPIVLDERRMKKIKEILNS